MELSNGTKVGGGENTVRFKLQDYNLDNACLHQSAINFCQIQSGGEHPFSAIFRRRGDPSTCTVEITPHTRQRELTANQQLVGDNPSVTILRLYQVDYAGGLINYQVEAHSPETEETFQVCLRKEEFMGNFGVDWALLTYWDEHRPSSVN